MSDHSFDIHQVLEHYGWNLPAERTGWVTVKCGAHDDSHQSCRINHDTGYVLCMACGFPRDGKAGDAVNVVRYYEGCGYKDAVRKCEDIAGSTGTVTTRPSRRGDTGSRGDARNRKYIPPRLRREVG